MPTSEELKKVFAKNLTHYMRLHGLNQTQISKIAEVSSQSVSNWLNAKLLPRMGAVERLANYFEISKSDLIEDKSNQSPPNPLINELVEKISELSDEQLKLIITIVDNLKSP